MGREGGGEGARGRGWEKEKETWGGSSSRRPLLSLPNPPPFSAFFPSSQFPTPFDARCTGYPRRNKFSQLLKTDESTRPCFCAFGDRDEALALIFNILGSKQGGKRFGSPVGWGVPLENSKSHPEHCTHFKQLGARFWGYIEVGLGWTTEQCFDTISNKHFLYQLVKHTCIANSVWDSSTHKGHDNKQLLDKVFVISRIIKVEVSVISRAVGRWWWHLPRPWLFWVSQKQNLITVLLYLVLTKITTNTSSQEHTLLFS